MSYVTMVTTYFVGRGSLLRQDVDVNMTGGAEKVAKVETRIRDYSGCQPAEGNPFFFKLESR